MAKKKPTSKQSTSSGLHSDVADQLEHAFLAGLGALSNAHKVGSKTFESLVKQGEDYRDKTSRKTETLIDEVQDAIRGMTDDAQSKATGLLHQMRDVSNLDKLHSVFDSRVADALDRLSVPTKSDIDAINKKLNKIVRLLDDEKKTASKKTRSTTKRKTKKTAK